MPTLKYLRDNSKEVLENIKLRKNPEKEAVFNNFIEKDNEWRVNTLKEDKIRQKRNSITQKIKEFKSQNKETSTLLSEAKKLPEKLKLSEEQTKKIKAELDNLFLQIPNILHESVPFGKDDSENVTVLKEGNIKKKKFELVHHGKLAADLGVADFERAVKISGSGFYFLMGDLARLDFALQMFAIDKLIGKGFIIIQPPFLMNKEPYLGVTDLPAFEEVIYKLEGAEQYLIATSEHPMAAMFMNEILEEKKLPLKLAGISPCFRKEIGKHGLDERGFFRVHQFNKIEQFIFCKPEDSWSEFEELAKNSEELLKDLKIPFEKVNVCTGDIGEVASKKYDLNGWSSREEKYIELMSCSNCTDYQSVRLGIKYRKEGSMDKEYIHTLNNTMIATTRTLRVIIENYQTENKTIEVPTVLRKYMGGIEEIVAQKRF